MYESKAPLIEAADLLMDVSHRLKFGKSIETPHTTFERLAIECRESEIAGQRLMRELAQAEGACEILVKAMADWKPITTPPPDGDTVLGFWINGERHTGSVWEGGWVPAWENQNNNWSLPSHWMVLPDEPKSE
jgi:hypothetical protein